MKFFRSLQLVRLHLIGWFGLFGFRVREQTGFIARVLFHVVMCSVIRVTKVFKLNRATKTLMRTVNAV